MPLIYGINPVLEALEAGERIEKIYLLTGKKAPVFRRIYSLAKDQKIQFVLNSQDKLDRLVPGRKHQGVVALISAVDFIPLDILIENIHSKGEVPNLVLLDRLNDPYNFGAVIRSAEVLGIHGIIFCPRESVPVTDLVIKASAGAVFHIDICKVDNTSSALGYLRNSGIWIYASSSHASKPMWEMDFTQPQVIIIGSEGKGIRPLLLKNSDDIFRIPQVGKTESLNVSVSAGIIMAEVLKQRQQKT